MWLIKNSSTGRASKRSHAFFAGDPMLTPIRDGADFRSLIDELRRKHDQWANKYR